MSSFYEDVNMDGYTNPEPEYHWDAGEQTRTHNKNLRKNIAALPKQLREDRAAYLFAQNLRLNDWSCRLN